MDYLQPMIDATLTEWLEITLTQPLYVATIAFCAFLLTALLYNIRISGLKKKNLATEQAKTQLDAQLNDAQQQVQQAQDESSTFSTQLEQQQQRADSAEQQLSQRNQQITATVQRLATQFDIGERPLPVSSDLKAEENWQQNDKVIDKLLETLRTEKLAKTELEKFYQAEQNKATDAHTRLADLQAQLEQQTNLVLSLQQQHDNNQQILAEALEKHQADATQRLLELEQQFGQQINALKNADSTSLEVSKRVETKTDSTDSLKSLFKKTVPVQETLPTVATDALVSKIDSATVEATVEKVVDTIVETKPEVVQQESEKTSKESALTDFYNKIAHKKPTTESVSKAIQPKLMIESSPVIIEEPATPEKTGAVKGLFKKFTTAKPEPVAPTPIAQPKIKPTPVETTSVAKGLFKKFAKTKPEAVEIIPPPIAEKIAPPPVAKKVPIAKPAPVDPILIDDGSSGRIEAIADKITDAVEGIKGLFGKNK